MAGWSRDYYFTEITSDKLLYIHSKGMNRFNDLVCEIEAEYPEISSFHTDEFSVFLNTSDERFTEIKKGVLKIINKRYKEVL